MSETFSSFHQIRRRARENREAAKSRRIEFVNNVDFIFSSLGEVVKLANTARLEIRARQAKLDLSLREIEIERDTTMSESGEWRAWRRIASFLVPVPFVRGALLKRLDKEVSCRIVKSDALASKARSIREDIGALFEADSKLRQAISNLTKSGETIPNLGGAPPAILTSVTSARANAEFLSKARRGLEWIDSCLSVVAAMGATMTEWSLVKAEYVETKRMEDRRRADVSPVAEGQRIYLPVPFKMGQSAVKLGAKLDMTIQSGVSRVYVTKEMDLSPFREMLPLVYRPRRPRFSFPPIPMRASGQNLWGILNRESWTHIRSSASSMTGKRCMICGRHGTGFFAEKVFGAEDRGLGVECHEIWEWSVPDPSTGVGIQKLKRLMVLCTDCHMMFHSGFAVLRARDVGLEEEARRYIEKRRCLVNAMTPQEVNAGLEQQREALRRMTGIDTWIMDLSSLGQQQYMIDRVPVARENNDASFKLERIAGLMFESDSGRVFHVRELGEIYAELTNTVSDNYNVVVLGGRR